MLCALFIGDFWVFSAISLRTHQIISSGLRTVNSNLRFYCLTFRTLQNNNQTKHCLRESYIDRQGFPTPPRVNFMPRLRHIHIKEYPYVTTTVTLQREPIFADYKAADILLEGVLFGKEQQWYYLLSFVIMPDHMHLILIPRGKNISECMKSIKGFSARKINALLRRNGSIWQSGFYDYVLDSEEKVLTRMRYIEDNPVRKGMVNRSEDYEYSSAKYRGETDFPTFF